MVCDPEPAVFEKKNPVFWLIHVPQLALHDPNEGVELKSKFVPKHRFCGPVKTGVGVFPTMMVFVTTSAKQVPVTE